MQLTLLKFIQLKDGLSQKVDNFIKKGTNIMTIWTERNIMLLKLERCTKSESPSPFNNIPKPLAIYNIKFKLSV
jgi:hypothetical protein